MFSENNLMRVSIFFPRPLAGEGEGEGLIKRALTSILSHKERKHEGDRFGCCYQLWFSND